MKISASVRRQGKRTSGQRISDDRDRSKKYQFVGMTFYPAGIEKRSGQPPLF
ncbi:hypothetical protein HOLDEFILI_02840 [Holdemania filiformis DSM 12042]|uniref:Uncharacterized protein n=1 Tax=Holdemania filiformis DSM 12042 TaxID=545696 RepID=B9YAI3_9FIRM|nr:hypothetical protein HOLDEFILI_02840 [Holdemania filiformis DSM 12042]